MRVLLLSFIFCFIIGCSGNKDENSNTAIGSSFVKNEVVPDSTLSAASYSKEALEIMEKHKKKLKSILPQMILAEVEVYKKTLAEIEKMPAMTYSLEETNLAINLERHNAGNTIMEKELELNQIYFQLFNELSLLNKKYEGTLSENEFKDFYDSGPIVLAEEVMIKVDELVRDENKRFVSESRKEKIDLTLSFVSVIPGATVCKGVLGGLTQAAKVYKAGITLPESATLMSKIPLKIMNEKVANFVAKTFKNDQIRSKTSMIVGNSGTAISKGASGTRFAHSYLRPDQASEMFKVLENKINGRIGDFSDGILAVHMQKVRDIIKFNAAKLTVERS